MQINDRILHFLIKAKHLAHVFYTKGTILKIEGTPEFAAIWNGRIFFLNGCQIKFHYILIIVTRRAIIVMAVYRF